MGPLRARYRFFAGKGGVGKTTCAAASALREAERGHDVLIVSIDPAHSLGDALDAALGRDPVDVPVRGRGRLRALEMDADAALDAWLAERREVLREIASRGTYLAPAEIDRFFELALPGVDELVALIELERVRKALGPELVVVDTAPTGHALRMLETPATLAQIARVLDDMQEKHRVLAGALMGGTYQGDAADRLIADIDAQAQEVTAMLRDRASAAVTWIALPEALSVAETIDGTAALARGGIAIDEIVVNRVTPAPSRPCALCDARRAEERRAVKSLLDLERAPV
ncbi:MAG: ArsA family ATPase, partial [Myxococcota bacterium]|nr:ArsA family ATPase [Myxococcota bacterium]